jgi:hypothetical protein
MQGITGVNNGGFSLYDATNSVTRFAIDPSGRVGIGTATPAAEIEVDTGSASTVGAIIKGYSSQTVDLQQWQDSTGAVKASISATGSATVQSIGILGGGTSPTYHTIFQGSKQSVDIIYTLPSAQGGTNAVLANDGTGTLSWASQFDIARYTPFYYTDFLGPAGATTVEPEYPFDLALLNSGTQAKIAGTASHPGILRISSSTTANSGAYIITDATAFLLAGGEVFEVIFSPQVSGNTSTTLRMGFHDTTTYSAPVDGAYFEMAAGSMNIYGKTASNSTYSTTGTSYALTVGSWYRALVVLNSNATQVNFYLYDESGNQLWTDSLTTNIPTASGRNTGAGVITTNSGTTATVLTYFDYMAVGIIGRKLTR